MPSRISQGQGIAVSSRQFSTVKSHLHSGGHDETDILLQAMPVVQGKPAGTGALCTVLRGATHAALSETAAMLLCGSGAALTRLMIAPCTRTVRNMKPQVVLNPRPADQGLFR